MSEPTMDITALYKLSYGLYVVTSNDGSRDNGLIVNTVIQVTDSPKRVAVTINKQNYSHEVIRKTRRLCVNALDTSAPFSLFQNYGFQSGRTADKFAGQPEVRTAGGLRRLLEHCNAYLDLEVESYVDLQTHGMFLCTVLEAQTLSDAPSMTYEYYHAQVKPKPQPKKKGYVCKICGYVYEGDPLPEDFICPWCKHGSADFEPLA